MQVNLWEFESTCCRKCLQLSQTGTSAWPRGSFRKWMVKLKQEHGEEEEEDEMVHHRF